MLEEHTYFCMMYLCWQRNDAWRDYGIAILGDVPAALRAVLLPTIRKGILRDLHGQVRMWAAAGWDTSVLLGSMLRTP